MSSQDTPTPQPLVPRTSVPRRARRFLDLPEDRAEFEDHARQVLQQTTEAAHSPGTRRKYDSAWEAFTHFCQHMGYQALPASHETVLRFLVWYGLTRRTGTLRSANSALHHHHRQAGFAYPKEEITAFLTGHARLTGRPAEQKAPLYLDDIQNLSRMLDAAGGPAAIRDRAMILFGYAGALRASEVVAAQFRHIRINHKGLTLLIPRSKEDQEGQGQEISMVRTVNTATCPIVALEEWIQLLKDRNHPTEGPIFRVLRSRGGAGLGDARIGEKPMTEAAYRLMLKRHCMVVGIDPATIGGHSLRAGSATQAAENGASIFEIAAQGRWKTLESVKRYVRTGTRFQSSASAKLGL